MDTTSHSGFVTSGEGNLKRGFRPESSPIRVRGGSETGIVSPSVAIVCDLGARWTKGILAGTGLCNRLAILGSFSIQACDEMGKIGECFFRSRLAKSSGVTFALGRPVAFVSTGVVGARVRV